MLALPLLSNMTLGNAFNFSGTYIAIEGFKKCIAQGVMEIKRDDICRVVGMNTHWFAT